MLGVFENHGVRFRYPLDWDLQSNPDGSRTTVELFSQGSAFAMVSIDEGRPEPQEMVDEALAAMRQEYPELESQPMRLRMGGHLAVGYDIEFFSLDLVVSCMIRCFRTSKRTIMLFGQWPDDEEEDGSDIASLMKSLEEAETEED